MDDLQSAPVANSPDSDAVFMRRALSLAENGWGRVAPNPLVGAVVVRDGKIVGEGWHAEYGQDHAEVMALRDAGELARGATLYVTLEPCSHHGKTPPCTDAVLRSGVSRVVIGCPDPSARAGGGAALLKSQGVAVETGVEGDPARRLVASFLHGATGKGSRRPWIELKLALSLDARIADSEGNSAWITGPEARREVHRMRAGHDAIAVGSGTVLADDPRLTVRDAPPPRVPPIRVVFDRQLTTPPASQLLGSQHQGAVWIVTSPGSAIDRRNALVERGAEMIDADDLSAGLLALAERGIRSMLVEGGAGIASTLLQADVVDRLSAFYAPILLGDRALNPFANLENPRVADARRWVPVRQQAFGPDTLISMERCSPD